MFQILQEIQFKHDEIDCPMPLVKSEYILTILVTSTSRRSAIGNDDARPIKRGTYLM
jgi:hypothetical protein